MEKQSIADYAKEQMLENGTIVEAVDEIPEACKIFGEDHIEYVAVLAGQILLQDMKGQLLNVVEGIGLPDRQETAIKRMVTNILHESHHEIRECLELVKRDSLSTLSIENVTITDPIDIERFAKELVKQINRR